MFDPWFSFLSPVEDEPMLSDWGYGLQDFGNFPDDEPVRAAQKEVISGRFHVTHPIDGFIEACGTISEAIDVAERWDMRSGYEVGQVEIYDRMARRRGAQLWRRIPLPATYCTERGDRLTDSSLFKCVERRGLKRVTDDMTRRLFE